MGPLLQSFYEKRAKAGPWRDPQTSTQTLNPELLSCSIFESARVCPQPLTP